MNTFIERSNALFVARPDTTRVSTRFTHKNVVRRDGETGVKPAVAIVKTYDPVSGTLYKFRVKRINELNRILRSLGPYPVDSQEAGEPATKRGIASLMAQKEFSEKEAGEAKEAPKEQAGGAGGAKGKKKKGRK